MGAKGFSRLWILVVVATLGWLLLDCSWGLAAGRSSIAFKHKPIAYFLPQHRINLNVELKVQEGVKIARCYFKVQDQADYVFVPMRPVKKNVYEAILPAPNDNVNTLDYLFLAVTKDNRVYRTRTYTVTRKDDKKIPPWQTVPVGGVIEVSTELSAPPTIQSNYADSIRMDIVESSLRFGMVSGLGIYSATEIAAAGGISGSAASAASAGMISSAGMSTTALVATAAAVAAGIGAAAISGTGGGNGGSSGGAGTQCNETVHAGGNTPETFMIEMGRTSGRFKIDYNTYNYPDRIVVRYEGRELQAKPPIGCIATGDHSRSSEFTYAGHSSQVEVYVEPNCDKNPNSLTQWDFTVHCPESD